MTRTVRCAGCALILAGAALAGCRGKEEAVGASTLGAVRVDTSNRAAMDGVSDEQLKSQAQALTPDQAMAAGMVVDTTIHMENLGGSDTVRASSPAPDSVAKGSSQNAVPGAP